MNIKGGLLLTVKTRLTYLVVKFGQLHLDFLALEEMILRLLTHRRDQIKLPGHRIGLLQI